MKKLYIIFALSLLVNILLSVYLIRVKPVCERYHVDEIDRSYEEIPDETMARKIADAIEMERIGNGEKAEYDVTVDFNSQSNEWEIVYEFKENGVLVKTETVCIRKDNGMITIQ